MLSYRERSYSENGAKGGKKKEKKKSSFFRQTAQGHEGLIITKWGRAASQRRKYHNKHLHY